MAKMNICIR